MSDKRKDKRWKREHGKRTKGKTDSNDGAITKGPDNNIRIIYRPKTDAEARRRVKRAETLMGVPFIQLPGITDHKTILFTSKNGTPIPAEAVEMVFNDALLMDAISDWGKDGPLTKDTYDTDLEQEVYEYAQKAYAGVEIPEKLRRPKIQ